jgi:hypothetical protein
MRFHASPSEEASGTPIDTHSVAVVIPAYSPGVSETDRLSLRRCSEVLFPYPTILLASSDLDVSGHLELVPHARCRRLDGSWFTSRGRYNVLLLSDQFYGLFADFDFILIHQLDAYVFYDALNEWVARGYDYVGSPFWADYGQDKAGGLVGVGNGGFSLRKTAACRRILAQAATRRTGGLARRMLLRWRSPYARLEDLREHERPGEDLWWSDLAPRVGPFHIAPIEEAVYFAFEMGLDLLGDRYDRRLPFGCHAAWNLEMILRLQAGEPPHDDYERSLQGLLERAT